MKIIKNQPFEVCKERSYVSCIFQGMSIGSENVSSVWKNVWPLFLLSLLCNFPFGLLLNAAVAVMMPKWSETGFVPRISFGAQWRDVLKVFCRLLSVLFVVAVFAGVWFMLLSSAVAGGCPVWVLILVSAAMLVAAIPLQWVRLEMMFGNKGVKASFAEYVTGIRNTPKLYAFYLLTGLFVLVVLVLASVPLIIQMMVMQQVSVAEANGDMAYLPWHFWLLFFIASAISNAVMFYVTVLFSHAEYLFWGSISASEKSRKLIEEIPAESEPER